MIEWINTNKEAIIALAGALYIIAKFIVNLTPSEKDNNILAKVAGVVDKIVDLLIPNLKKGGGTHTANVKDLFKKKK